MIEGVIQVEENNTRLQKKKKKATMAAQMSIKYHQKKRDKRHRSHSVRASRILLREAMLFL